MTIDREGAAAEVLVLSPVIDGTSSRTPGKPRRAGARLSEKTRCPCPYRRGIAMSVEPSGVRRRACGCRLSGAALSACRAVRMSGCRHVGLSGCRAVGRSDPVGLPGMVSTGESRVPCLFFPSW